MQHRSHHYITSSTGILSQCTSLPHIATPTHPQAKHPRNVTGQLPGTCSGALRASGHRSSQSCTSSGADCSQQGHRARTQYIHTGYSSINAMRPAHRFASLPRWGWFNSPPVLAKMCLFFMPFCKNKETKCDIRNCCIQAS